MVSRKSFVGILVRRLNASVMLSGYIVLQVTIVDVCSQLQKYIGSPVLK